MRAIEIWVEIFRIYIQMEMDMSKVRFSSAYHPSPWQLRNEALCLAPHKYLSSFIRLVRNDVFTLSPFMEQMSAQWGVSSNPEVSARR